MQAPLPLLTDPTKYLFFTGKGGVGKTSISTAVAIALADVGKRVLLVSTDAASNLDEMLGVELRNTPVPVPGVQGLAVLNIDPNTAAEHYRARVITQMGTAATQDEVATVREQLSGACTTEIATFDEFASLLAEGGAWDHVIFDTAPSGHTLRLLSLPKAWSGFLLGNERGASCLGPHSGLKMQEQLFNKALAALNNPALTTIVLVARPEKSALSEAARTATELQALGLHAQRLVINAVFKASKPNDAVANALEAFEQQTLNNMPGVLQKLPTDQVPLRPVDSVGIAALRALLSAQVVLVNPVQLPAVQQVQQHKLAELVDALAQQERGLIMVMGKGGVGKTTIAAALALGLVQRGKSVHVSTTDPAAHLMATLEHEVAGLSVGRIDPKVETQHYIDKQMAARAAGLSEDEKALLLEDLQSPCTEEVAVFHAFSRVVAQARSAFVVLDTAPTGHSLLLMDATGAYHKQVLRELAGKATSNIVTPLMRLQDPDYTRIILVTLPEATPVSQAAALQADLRRAQIEPFAWVVNKSLLATGTQDPLLQARLQGELTQLQRIAKESVHPVYVVPWQLEPPIGVSKVQALVQR